MHQLYVLSFVILAILERIHKLNYLASVEASEKIVFPRVKRRLLQLKQESENTFKIPSLREMEEALFIAKSKAVVMAKRCNLNLDRYLDEDLYFPANDRLIQSAVENDFEVDESEDQRATENVITSDDAIIINEDVARINLVKSSSSGISTYSEAPRSSTKRNYPSSQKGKSCFVQYGDAYIRKTTALYLLQEKNQLSNDRLLRVRAAQPSHLYNDSNITPCNRKDLVESGDLCAFRQEDSEKILLGRIIQFSYLEGTKKQREYSSTYVDVSCDSFEHIGVFCNWFQPKKAVDKISFFPLDIFTIGYHPMTFYISTIESSSLQSDEEGSFSIDKGLLETMFPDWENKFYTELC